MTILEMVQDVFEALGEPSDLEYRDVDTLQPNTASEGWKRFMRVFNNAQTAIATWKFPEGRQLRFRSLEDVANFKTQHLEATLNPLTPYIDDTFLLSEITLDNNIKSYVGWLLEVPGATTPMYRGRITSATPDGASGFFITLSPAPQHSLIAPMTGVYLYSREYFFKDVAGSIPPFIGPVVPYDGNNGMPLEVLDVEDVSHETEVTFTSRHETFIQSVPALGVPTQYYKLANGLRFDVWPEDEINYSVRYFRAPRPFGVDTNQVCELPVNFHQCVALHALWWGYRRMQENNSAYSTKRDLDDMLRRLRTEFDLEGEFGRSQWSVKVVPY